MDDIPEDWCCPDCAVREKVDFDEIGSEESDRAVQTVRLRAVRIRVRRGQGVAGGRHRARAPGGMTSPRTGAARTAGRPSRTSRWSRSPGRDRQHGRARRPGRDSVARVSRPTSGIGSAIPYAEASRVLLRDSILDGMRDMLLARDWSSITLSDVARAAGISRQTIYNEFGSRQGLAEGYALRLADRLVDRSTTRSTTTSATSTPRSWRGSATFFTESASDPLVISLLTGAAKPDLLQIITTDSAPIISRCSAAADRIVHEQLGAGQRGGRRSAGQGHRPAGDELRVDAARSRPRCGPGPGPIDDAVRRTLRCYRYPVAGRAPKRLSREPAGYGYLHRADRSPRAHLCATGKLSNDKGALHDCTDTDRRRPQRHRLQGRRPGTGRVRPQGDPAGRARDAGPDGAAPRVLRGAAAQGRAGLGFAAHDHPDRGADRDAGGARCRGALGVVQHLLHPGPRRRRRRRRPARHRRGAQGHPGVRVEGREPRGVLVGRRADAHLAGRAGQHDPRRRR